VTWEAHAVARKSDHVNALAAAATCLGRAVFVQAAETSNWEWFMKRIRTIAALTVVVALALTGVAAGAIKIKGGTTEIKLSQAATNVLSANHLTVTPLSPAAANASSYTFPISHGRLKNRNLHGVVRQRGGFAISNGTRTVKIRHLTLVSRKRGVYLWALVRMAGKKLHGHGASAHATATGVRRIGKVTDVSIKNQTATGTVRLTAFSANGINTLAGKKIAKAGTPIGSITITPTIR
jgi:hypothetical protein